MDKISSERRSENMRRIRSKDTKPEIMIRKLIYANGYRYRLHWRDLPGKPDIVFPGRKKAVFVHGCFWHQHSDRKCKHVHKPKSRVDYWASKLEKNRQRDRENQEKIREMGWNYLVIWECQVNDYGRLTEVIRMFLDGNN